MFQELFVQAKSRIALSPAVRKRRQSLPARTLIPTLSATSIVASLSRTVTKDNAQNSINQQQNVNAGQSFLNSNGQPSSSLQGPSTVSTLPAGKGSVTTTAPTISGTNGSVIQNVLLSGMNNNLGVDTLDSSLRSAVLSASDFSVIISALKQNIGATIVSNPRLLVASGENALIHVGENVPYAANSTTQQGSGGNSTQSTVAMIKVGVQLEVTPVVNSENSVTLKIKPEISSVSSTVLIDGNPVPVVTTRDVTTLFNVESGRTVCIGGLVTDNNQTTETKIPLLGDIPIIGKYLFSHSHADRAKSEVIIFVTVTTIKAERIKTLDGYPTTSRLIHKFTHNEELEALEEQRVREEEAKHLEQLKKTQNQPATNAVKGRASLFD